MQKTILRTLWWAAAALYILITYATLGIMPVIWSRLNNFLGGKGLLIQYIVYFIIGLSILIYIIFVKKERAVAKYLLFLFFIVLFFIMVKLEKNPGEKIHMAQYGLLGVLLYNALKIDFNRFTRNIYLAGSGICLVVGALDEVIQGILPNRFFTWHDVFINGLSGIIALLVIRFNILRREKVPLEP